jgi:carboxylesterase type B
MPAHKFNAKGLVRTGYMAAQDVSAAVRFFKANADKYRIDTNRIFLLGQSAGAVAILHALYMTRTSVPQTPSSTRSFRRCTVPVTPPP